MLRETTWPLGRSGAEGVWRLRPRKGFAFYIREYLVTNVVLAVLVCTLVVRTWAHRAWAARPAFIWRANVVLKRTFDIFTAMIGFILSAPIFLVLPIIIKLDSPGPVFFRQLRVGINRRQFDRRHAQVRSAVDRRARDRRRNNLYGRPFQIIKFRSMVEGAEKKCGPVWATNNDPRVTRLGAFLRKTRLDELPQLINVLKGEMSLVGPRPERPFFVEKLSHKVPGFLDRLRVVPGITGLAQVKNGYDTSIDGVHQKIDYDLSYIRGWSLIKDLKILLATIVVVVTGRGAY